MKVQNFYPLGINMMLINSEFYVEVAGTLTINASAT
jgi:hypothetical protein